MTTFIATVPARIESQLAEVLCSHDNWAELVGCRRASKVDNGDTSYHFSDDILSQCAYAQLLACVAEYRCAEMSGNQNLAISNYHKARNIQ